VALARARDGSRSQPSWLTLRITSSTRVTVGQREVVDDGAVAKVDAAEQALGPGWPAVQPVAAAAEAAADPAEWPAAR
jgi:hypothetical protein